MGQFYKNTVVITFTFKKKKKMNFMKMRTFYKKKNYLFGTLFKNYFLFLYKTQFCILIKNSNLKNELYKKLHFWNF